MEQKIVVLTGGNAGIGKATAKGLAEKGATLILGCRNSAKAQKAVLEIQKATGNKRVLTYPLDLASFESIRGFAAMIRENYPHVDVLLNNAAALTNTFQTTREGFEWQIGVNYIGHFLLTRELLPWLQKGEAPRVINVSSNGHYRGAINFDSFRNPPQDYRLLDAYCQAKLANVLFTHELARRYPAIESYALHPGFVRTHLGVKSSGWLVSLVWNLLRPFMIPASKGAQTSIYLASSTEVAGPSGTFFDENQQPKRAAKLAYDEALAQKLWEKTDEWVQQF